MPDQARIEQRRRFERVFLREVRTDQELAVMTYHLIGEQILLHVIEALQKIVERLLMPAPELFHHVVEQGDDFRLRKRHDPGYDPLDPSLDRRVEKPEVHPGEIRPQDESGSLKFHL